MYVLLLVNIHARNKTRYIHSAASTHFVVAYVFVGAFHMRMFTLYFMQLTCRKDKINAGMHTHHLVAYVHWSVKLFRVKRLCEYALAHSGDRHRRAVCMFDQSIRSAVEGRFSTTLKTACSLREKKISAIVKRFVVLRCFVQQWPGNVRDGFDMRISMRLCVRLCLQGLRVRGLDARIPAQVYTGQLARSLRLYMSAMFFCSSTSMLSTVQGWSCMRMCFCHGLSMTFFFISLVW